jgi:hypothetical protein
MCALSPHPAAGHSRAIAARAIPLALVEHAFDMESIDKRRNPRRDLRRHGHGADHVATAFEHRFAFGRIGGHFRQFEFGPAILTPQRHPDPGLTVGQVVAVICGFRAEQFNAR